MADQEAAWRRAVELDKQPEAGDVHKLATNIVVLTSELAKLEERLTLLEQVVSRLRGADLT
jgi:hypothetical protein